MTSCQQAIYFWSVTFPNKRKRSVKSNCQCLKQCKQSREMLVQYFSLRSWNSQLLERALTLLTKQVLINRLCQSSWACSKIVVTNWGVIISLEWNKNLVGFCRTLDFSFTNFVGFGSDRIGLDFYVNLSESESRKTQSAHLWCRPEMSMDRFQHELEFNSFGRTIEQESFFME